MKTAVSLFRHLPQPGHIRSITNTHRRNRHPIRHQRIYQLRHPLLLLRICAICQQNNMLHLIWAASQRLCRRFQTSSHINTAAARPNLPDQPNGLLPLTGRNRPNWIIRCSIHRNHRDFIKIIQQFHNPHSTLSRQLNLGNTPLLRPHAARAINNNNDTHRRKALLVLNLHINRQRLFQRRAEISPHAITFWPANHNQPTAPITHKALQKGHFAGRQILGVNVDHDDRSVAAQLTQARWHGRRCYHINIQTGRCKGQPQLG